jgi:ADP-heptose:LPS heptosyltransferase
MSTQCFKGLKERHHNLPFNFMTQRQYMDIVEGNPYVDKIIEWDEKEIEQYKFVYNPHSDKILLGGWNNLDTRLHDMYPYFTKVKADDMFIEQVKPNIELPDQYIVIQTSGGQKEYRTYEHMDIVLKSLKLPTVHLGSLTDKSSNANFDLRGKLSWRESAWVMKHAKAAIVIDSFLSHLAGALNTLVVVLFGPAPARVVGPKSDPNITIFLEPNKLDVCPILANCWGQPGKQPCKSPCINSISPFAVVESVEKLLGEN